MSIPTFDDVVLKTLSEQLSLMADRMNKDSNNMSLSLVVTGTKTAGYRYEVHFLQTYETGHTKGKRLEETITEAYRRLGYEDKSNLLSLTYRPGRDDEVQRVETSPPAKELVEAVQSMEPVDDIPY